MQGRVFSPVVRPANVVECANVGMIQRGDGASLPLKPLLELGIAGKMLRKDLYGDVALQAGVAPSIHLAHAPRTDGGDDLVRPKPFARLERHGSPKEAGLLIRCPALREVYIKGYKSVVVKTYSAKEVAKAVGTNWSAT